MFEIKNKVTINELDSVVTVLQDVNSTLNNILILGVVFLIWKLTKSIISYIKNKNE